MAGLVGCTATVPEVTAPALWITVPDRFIAQDNPLDGPAEGAWWLTFADPRLDTLVQQALGHNHDLAAAVARLEAAAAQARLAGADLAPRLDVGLDGARRRQNFIGLPIPGSNGVLSKTYNSFGVDLTASWEVDLWGRVRAGQGAAAADLQAAAVDLRAAHQSLAAQTAKAYFATVEARLQHMLALRTVESFEATERDVARRFAGGTRSALDLRLVEANLRSARAGAAQRQEQVDRTRRQLELLLGTYPAGTVEHATDLPPTPPAIPTGLPAQLLTRRPDVVAAERRLAAQDQRVARAAAAFYPRLSLTGSLGTASSELKDVLDPDYFIWSLIGNLTMPLFHGGRLAADHELEQARLHERAALYSQAALRAFTEVESALAAETTVREQALHQAAAAVAARSAQDLAEQRYQQGLENITTVLDAQRRALDAESQSLAVRRLQLDIRIDLHLALGGGFDMELDPQKLMHEEVRDPIGKETSGSEAP